MSKLSGHKRWTVLLVFLLGLAAGMGILEGLRGTGWIGDAGKLVAPPQLLQASATHGSDTLAIATGPIDEGTEGFFILDFITGELRCWTINPRTGQISGMFRHNVVTDLGVEQGKTPKYLLVTGAANFRYGAGNVRPAGSVVYVADANTGRFAAYMLPWNRAAAQYNASQINPMVLLGRGSIRNISLE